MVACNQSQTVTRCERSRLTLEVIVALTMLGMVALSHDQAVRVRGGVTMKRVNDHRRTDGYSVCGDG